ncbi:MAG TPA: hypothetical protein VE398_11675 [Acidobacteriota bacterium]|nr:hypothetical protein [Acidobacteriota bacterium]
MTEIRLNILDAGRAICGAIHGSVAESAVAGLSAEPETIEELQDALARFIKPVDNGQPFEAFDAGTNDEPWDAGIMFIDLAAHIVAAESSYSMPSAEGQVRYHDGVQATDVWLPYYAPDDWLFVDSVAQYKAVCEQRRAERSAAQPLRARPVLYGTVVEFIVKQCLEARDAKTENPIAEIHAKWLMTPRPDLRGKSPRELMLEKFDFIDLDLHSRELQWSFVGKPAPCLSKNSAAYRFAGFGRHEMVVYYDLLRHLLSECWKRLSEGKDVPIADEVARLTQIKADWLECPDPDFDGRNPAYILECERKRLPLIASPEEMVMDEDCPMCQAMAEEYTPTFCHLDGCNMDDDFPFSFCRTRSEWEEEERVRREFSDEFNRRWEERERKNLEEEPRPINDDTVIH